MRCLSVFVQILLILCPLISLVTGWREVAGAADLWVVIVNSSRYWFNYRHAANAIAVYDLVKTLGAREERIIFMNALDIGNDHRNPDPGMTHFAGSKLQSLDLDTLTIDYVGEEASAQSFLGILTGRSPGWATMKKPLATNANSSVLIYMAGHGGDEFFKFHDSEELTAQDLGDAFHEMYIKGRYKDILFILDTCQASTMANYITAPNIITLASSAKGENSYAYPTHDSLGVSIIDRFTHSMVEFIRNNIRTRDGRSVLPKSLSLGDLVASFQPSVLHSTATVVASANGRGDGAVDLKRVKLYQYFGGDGGDAHKSSEDSIDVFSVDETGSFSNPSYPSPEARQAVVEALLGLTR